MNTDLTGKRALVCGGSKGIGRAAAVELSRLGASVTLLARNAEVLEQVKGQLFAAAGQKHDHVAVDLTNTVQLKEKIAEKVKEHKAYHILVNVGGGPPPGPVLTASPDDFLKVFTEHLLAGQCLVQALTEGMKSGGYGRIINVISTSVKQPIKGLGVSNTIRGAVASWSKTLAAELGPHGITVNNILPGPIDTDRLKEVLEKKAARTGRSIEEVIAHEKAEVPLGRFGQPEEIAQVIAFLATPAAAYVNGINLPVDGGRTGCL